MPEKSKGVVTVMSEAVGQILDSVTSLVDGSIFGEESSDGTNGKRRVEFEAGKRAKRADTSSEDDGGGTEGDSVSEPKPAKPSKPKLSTFQPAKPASKKGEASGEQKPDESGAGDEEAP